jgi:hypothetical protein
MVSAAKIKYRQWQAVTIHTKYFNNGTSLTTAPEASRVISGYQRTGFTDWFY